MGFASSCVFWIQAMALFAGVLAANCSVHLEGCLRCDTSGLRCVRCRDVMEEATRVCRTSCGVTQREAWSTRVDLMGRLCLETSLWIGLGFTGSSAAVFVGALTGICVSLAALFAALVYYRRRRASRLLRDDSSDSTLTVMSLSAQERAELNAWVTCLRPQAPIFLAMLNDTRRQAREAAQGGNTAALQAFRPIFRDLFALLLFLNQPANSTLRPPPDWRKLLPWAERAVSRYQRQSTVVGELVSFLPDCPSDPPPLWLNNNDAPTLNRFSFSDTDQEEDPQGLVTWSASDFVALGFRPQDEITTEL